MLGIFKSFYTKFYSENIFYCSIPLVTPKKMHWASMHYASIEILFTSLANVFYYFRDNTATS